MNENGNKRREWVKTAAIIFLAVMLVLTFFSNTIMNYSLPEVATQYVQSGSVTAKIRGTGTVESGDPYNIKVTESRKVSSVAVRVGDDVQAGDVLLYLEDAESDELKTARTELEAAQKVLAAAWDSYYVAMLSGDITAADIQAANGNVSPNTYRQQITEAQNAITPLQEKVDELQRNLDNIDAQIQLENGYDSSAQSRVESAKAAMDAAYAQYQQTVSGGDAAATSSAEKNYNTAKENYEKAQAEWNSRQGSQVHANLLSQRASVEVNLYNAQKDLEEAEKRLSELTGMLSNKAVLDVYLREIADARDKVNDLEEQVEELTEKAIGGTVTADIAGTVTSINVVAGDTTSAAEPVVVLQPEGRGYTMSFSVTTEQARRLSVGDRADLVNAWRYDDVEVVLASIKPDPSDPGQQRLLTFDVTGSVVAGQTLNISVGQQSANFDCIVPNSALREDNNGKFILIVESRSTPLGNRYIASRVDVEVLASDDTKLAVSSAALSGYEFVITTSTQPVSAGQQVRLTDN